MINRQNLWFLTLFSLILVLGVYYITLPNEIFSKSELENVSKEVDVVVSESDKLVALRSERNEKISTTMSELQEKINSQNSSSEEKNQAFEQLQLLNLSKGKESYLEEKILNNYKIKSFIEINNDKINVTIASSSHNSTIANNIMRIIQEEFNDKKNITVKFES